MTLFHLGLGKLNVPIYDLVTLGAGFYIGYHEGKGINTSAATEYLTKYGPTAFTLAATPIMIKSMNAFTRGMNKKVAQKLENGDLNITLPDGSNKKFKR